MILCSVISISSLCILPSCFHCFYCQTRTDSPKTGQHRIYYKVRTIIRCYHFLFFLPFLPFLSPFSSTCSSTFLTISLVNALPAKVVNFYISLSSCIEMDLPILCTFSWRSGRRQWPWGWTCGSWGCTLGQIWLQWGCRPGVPCSYW